MQLFNDDFAHRDEFEAWWNSQVKKTRAGMVVWGVLMILAGIFAAGAPFSFYAIIQLVAGFALIIHGFVHVFSYVRAPEALRSSSTLVSGILNALLGFMLLVLPSLLTASTLVYLFAFLFILGGVDRLSYAHQMKRLEMPYAAAIAVGVINIVVGVVFILMPLLSTLMLGYILAAYLIVGGITLLIEAATVKRIGHAVA